MSARSRGALALALAALWSGEARAEGATSDARVLLEWSRGPGAESCVSADDAAREVERLLGRPVFAAAADAERRLVVSIERTSEPHGYRAHMTLVAASGVTLGSREITIEALSCESATEAFSLALAIIVDLPRTPEESAPPPAPSPSEARPERAPAPSPASRQPPGRVQAGLGLAGAIEANTRVSPGGHLVVLLEPMRFLPVLTGVLSTVRPHDFASRRAWLSSTRIEATLCLPPWSTRAFALFACLGPEATIHVGWGTGFGDDRSGVSATFGGIARAYGTYALSSHVQLFATIAVAATPQTLEVAFTDQDGARRTAFETSSVIPALSLGIAFEESLRTP
jgi:hypothetical protein